MINSVSFFVLRLHIILKTLLETLIPEYTYKIYNQIFFHNSLSILHKL